jgi:hypothetical protein
MAEMRPKRRTLRFRRKSKPGGRTVLIRSKIDTPITESSIIGMVAPGDGPAQPVAELMFMDFLSESRAHQYNQQAKFRYMFGGKALKPAGNEG